MLVDLHCHSTCSDGTEIADAVRARAAARGVALFALTDHDTTAGHAPLPGATTIRATELTCDHEGTTVHVLVYDRGGDWAAVEAVLAGMRAARAARLARMGERLLAATGAPAALAAGIDALVTASATRAVGRPDLARLVVACGLAATPRDAFAQLLYDGGPVDVPHAAAPAMADALAAARAANAACSLAHPHFYDGRPGDPRPPLGAVLARTYRDRGLTGLEAFYGLYDAAARRRWIALADELGLVCTGGSDWHGPERGGAAMNATSHVPFGVDLPPRRADALRRWLALA